MEAGERLPTAFVAAYGDSTIEKNFGHGKHGRHGQKRNHSSPANNSTFLHPPPGLAMSGPAGVAV